MTALAPVAPVVMLALLVGFAYFLSRSRANHPDAAAGRNAASSSVFTVESSLQRFLSGPSSWFLGFVLLIVVALVGTVVAVGGGPAWLGGAGFSLFGAVIGLSVLGFIAGGVFSVVKESGYGNALGVAAAAFTLGIVLIIAMTTLLLLGAF